MPSKSYSNKTYELQPEDQEKLLSYACRYKSMQTSINEDDDILTVWTSFADHANPTSIADKFKLRVISDQTPKMPRDEYDRRVLGK